MKNENPKKTAIKIVIFTLLIIVMVAITATAVKAEEHRYPAELFQMSEEDHDAVLKVITAESAEEDLVGHMMVVEVICNRAIGDPWFKNTLIGVVSQKGQFSTWKGRNKKTIMQDDLDAYENVRMQLPGDSAMLGYATVDPSRYVFFCTKSAYKKVGHRYMHNCFTYGNHVFGTQ